MQRGGLARSHACRRAGGDAPERRSGQTASPMGCASSTISALALRQAIAEFNQTGERLGGLRLTCERLPSILSKRPAIYAAGHRVDGKGDDLMLAPGFIESAAVPRLGGGWLVPQFELAASATTNSKSEIRHLEAVCLNLLSERRGDLRFIHNRATQVFAQRIRSAGEAVAPVAGGLGRVVQRA